MSLHNIPEIDDNFRTEPVPGLPSNWIRPRRDPVEPVPVGSYVVMVFRVTGYDRDCDGSLMARLAHVNRRGEESGWDEDSIGLYPDSDLIVDQPEDLWGLVRDGS